MNSSAKGKRWEAEVRKILESLGYKTEIAINKTIWLGPGRIISVAHDFFTCWDGMAIRGDEFVFYQVSSLEHLSDKIKKINGVGIEWGLLPIQTLILGRVKGRNPHFRLFWGREGYKWQGRVEMVKSKIVPDKKP